MAKVKLEEIKDKQGFVKQAPMCSNCIFFDSIIKKVETWGTTYSNETCLRCTVGNFKVSKTNYCDRHSKTKQKACN